MAYESLKQEIRKYIKTNGQNEITGQILQDVLIDMVNQYPSLDGYATQQWVENQGYISEADLTNYATQSWVSSNYATLSAVNELSYINGVTSDGLGRLTLTGHNFEATVLDFSHQHRWEELIDVPTNLRDLGITEEYLPLSGGNMTGDLTFASGNGISVYYQYGDPSDPEYDAILIENGVISVGNGGDITIGGNSVATQSWVQQQGYLTSAPVTSVAGYTGAVTVANLATALSLSNYATETWVTNQGYITSSGSCAYATSAGSAKILNGNVVQGSTSLADGDVLVYDSGAWYNTPRATYLSGYATLSAINALSYINGVTSDGLGRLTLTGPNFPATVLDLSHQHRWEELIDVPTNLRDLGITEEYLPLSGGTLSGTLTMSDDIMISGSNSIFFDIDNNIYADIYGSNSSRLYITGYDGIRLLISNPNQVTHAYLDITDSGVNINGDIVATQSWVQQQGYLTSAPVTSVAGYTGSVTVANLATALSLSNYATETWVTNQGYITSSGSCAYATSAGSAKILNGNVVQGSTSLADGDVLVYDSGAWYNTPRATYLSGYATQSWVSSNYATQSTVNGLSYINGVALNGDGSLSLTGHSFATTILDMTHQHRWEELTDRPLIDMWNDTMVAVNGIVSSGKIGAGVSATPSYMLEVVGQAMIYSNVGIGTSPASGISLDIDGTARANSFVNSSDIRKKDVIEYDVDPGFETVANAPTIRFTWKDRGMLDNRGECVGSIAQYWQRALPEAVMTDSEGYLSMQYDVIALIAAVSVAKRVASHEQRIAALERENALLRMDIKALKGEA